MKASLMLRAVGLSWIGIVACAVAVAAAPTAELAEKLAPHVGSVIDLVESQSPGPRSRPRSMPPK